MTAAPAPAAALTRIDPTAAAAARAPQRSARLRLRRLFSLVEPYQPAAFGALACACVEAVAMVLVPFCFAVALDSILTARQPGNLPQITVGCVAALVVAAIAHAGRNILINWIAEQILSRLEASGLLSASASARTVVADLAAVREALRSAMPAIAAGVAPVVLAVVLACAAPAGPSVLISGKLLAACATVALVLAAALAYLFWSVAGRSVASTEQAGAQVNHQLTTHLAGIATVQLFHLQVQARQRFEAADKALQEAASRAMPADAWFLPLLEWLGALLQAALLLTGLVLLQRPASASVMSPGLVAGLLLCAIRLMAPLRDAADRVLQAQAAFAALDRLDAPQSAAAGTGSSSNTSSEDPKAADRAEAA